jgi:hypothetical protein
MILRLSLLALGVVFMSTASAAELLSIDVDHDHGTYTMSSEVWFDANVEQVFEVFRYWDNSVNFSSAIVESRDLEPDELGRPQFYVRNKGCVLFFCFTFERQGYVESEPNSEILAFVDPETSDFHFSNERWMFEDRDGGTLVTYDLEMKPKFWIPPGIGPYVIKRKLRDSGGDIVDRIEAIAQAVSNE